jgi:hypothetical protein
MGYLYKHIRLDTNEIFYIGIGGFSKTEKTYSYKRAYEFRRRNNIWKKIVLKTDYKVEIIFENLTFKEACEKEKQYIKLYGRIDLNTGSLSNLTDGGEGTLNAVIKEETREKISKKLKGIPLSEETKRKISESLKGKIVSSETKKKLSLIKKGKKINHIISEETKEKLKKAKSGKNHPMYNKHHSEEAKLIISGNKKETYKGKNNPFYGKTHSEETKKKLSEINKSQIPVNRRKVMCIETGVIYNSVHEAQITLNIKHVSCVCSGKRKSAGGLTFKYVE